MDGRIAQLISKAEHHLAQQHYEKAGACLVAAEQIEPNNPSVRMLKELLFTVQNQTRKRTFFMRFFPRTLRKETGQDIAAVRTSDGESRKRILSLIGTAEYFLARGAVDSAYKSMIRASVLDPSAPEVIECEKRVMPARKSSRGQQGGDHKSEAVFEKLPAQKKIQNSLLERLKNGKLLA